MLSLCYCCYYYLYFHYYPVLFCAPLNISTDIANELCLPPFCRNNVWAKCPPGMFMQGIKRSTKLFSWLSDIEGLICCNPNHSPPISTYDDCYDKDVNVSLNFQGWTMCDADYYLAGFYRGNCKYLSCLDRFKCCKFMSRGIVDMDSLRVAGGYSVCAKMHVIDKKKAENSTVVWPSPTHAQSHITRAMSCNHAHGQLFWHC